MYIITNHRNIMTAADTHSITSADVQEHNRHIIRPPKFT